MEKELRLKTSGSGSMGSIPSKVRRYRRYYQKNTSTARARYILESRSLDVVGDRMKKEHWERCIMYIVRKRNLM